MASLCTPLNIVLLWAKSDVLMIISGRVSAEVELRRPRIPLSPVLGTTSETKSSKSILSLTTAPTTLDTVMVTVKTLLRSLVLSCLLLSTTDLEADASREESDQLACPSVLISTASSQLAAC